MKYLFTLLVTFGLCSFNYSMGPKFSNNTPNVDLKFHIDCDKKNAHVYKQLSTLSGGLSLAGLFGTGYLAGQYGFTHQFTLLSGISTGVFGLLTANFYNLYQYFKKRIEKMELIDTCQHYKIIDTKLQNALRSNIEQDLSEIITKRNLLNSINSSFLGCSIGAGIFYTYKTGIIQQIFTPDTKTKL